MKAPHKRGVRASGRDVIAQTTQKYSASPLVDPTVSILVLIAPNSDDLSVCAHGGYSREATVMVAAAKIVNVPTFVGGRNKGPPKAAGSHHRVFACDTYGCIWKNDAFLKALDAENRTTLLLAGYWLEREVVVATLYALAECYDVYVLLDASPARSREAARLAEARMLQAGATPLLTEQVLHEWIVETSNATQRAALSALME